MNLQYGHRLWLRGSDVQLGPLGHCQGAGTSTSSAGPRGDSAWPFPASGGHRPCAAPPSLGANLCSLGTSGAFLPTFSCKGPGVMSVHHGARIVSHLKVPNHPSHAMCARGIAGGGGWMRRGRGSASMSRDPSCVQTQTGRKVTDFSRTASPLDTSSERRGREAWPQAPRTGLCHPLLRDRNTHMWLGAAQTTLSGAQLGLEASGPTLSSLWVHGAIPEPGTPCPAAGPAPPSLT